ncbi:DEAD/DEAH box helicase, partial [Streptomyces sp. NPDC002073]
RDMTRLMQAAGITPLTTQVRSGEEALSRITGAQAPSGIPVTITAPVAEKAPRSGSSRPRRSRGGGGTGGAGGQGARRTGRRGPGLGTAA